MTLSLANVLTIIGLIFDILGAWLVAYEVCRIYRGEKHVHPKPPIRGDGSYIVHPMHLGARETEEYKKYQLLKYRYMSLGLFCLTFGFILQIIAVLIPLYHQ